MDPLVSIVIPAYNAARFIDVTIQSVIYQDFEDWELIIINDGSTDNTEAIVNEIKIKDKRIRQILIENGGVSNARNVGIKAGKSKFLAFLDADDEWMSGNLLNKITFLEQHRDVDWVFSDMYEADEYLNITGLAPPGRDKNILDDLLLWDGEVVPGSSSNIVMRRACLSSGILFDTEISTAADQDFCIQLASKAKIGKHINTPLWKYRILDNSMSRNIKIMEQDHMRVYQKAAKNKLFKSWLFKKQCFSNLYLIIAGSWWVNADNKVKGLIFLIRGLVTYPPNIFKMLSKLHRKSNSY